MWYARPPIVSRKRCTVTYVGSGEVKRDEILRSRRRRSSEASREGAFTPDEYEVSAGSSQKKFSRAQVLNRICTTRPQVFHSAPHTAPRSADLHERTRVECSIARS